MTVSIAFGYIGALLASVFFGSNYVPTKNFPQGDGMSFVWIFSSGVLVMGIISIFISGKAIFVYTGLIGGSLWATGNLCVIPIVKLIGLGLGLLLWGSTSLVTGFLVGKFGLFGVDKQSVAQEGMNWGGFSCIILAMVVFFFIKPTLQEEDSTPLLGKEANKYHIQEAAKEKTASIWDTIPPKWKTIMGLLLAIGSGILYGVNMVPMTLWVQEQKKANVQTHPLDFVLSHFIGIYLFSTVVFLIYCIVHRPPQIFPQSILPSYISGAMWGIAQCGLMMATQILGYTIGFPIGSAGPLIVSSLWSVLYFREIRGAKNLLFLAGSFALLATGIALLSVSQT
jgi:glucose uptake protein GlcU